ncbi:MULTISPECIES: hypothetical protein [unclassified Streptomyces]|uniref:hypothetical protein n=1 Tax=unclassified Streptomyces TaxID=2593676 RepID=UPI001FD32421|nr:MULTISPECIES: hypothetical protein [unclassified Streptomyces]MCZ4095326.1 hypothetical protein [Streptomyces sp. H39-C1]
MFKSGVGLVAVVVGLHFLPLAAVFEQPGLRVPAALLVAAGAAAVAVWLGDGPDKTVRLAVGLISALALGGTALWTVRGGAVAASADVPESMVPVGDTSPA